MAGVNMQRGCPTALASWVLLLFGCHGWFPALFQPFVLATLGAILLAGAGPSRFGAWAWLLRFVPMLAGVAARQCAGGDVFAILGLFLGLQCVERGASSVRRPRIDGALLSLAILQVILCTSAGFQGEEALGAAIGATASWFVQPTASCPVFGGARAAVVLVLLIVTLRDDAFPARAWRALLVLALLVAAAVAVSSLAAALPAFGSSPDNDPVAAMIAAQLPWIPGVVGVVAATLLTRGRSSLPTETATRVPACLAVVGAIAVLASLPPATLRPAQSVLFYRPGFSNWEIASASLDNAGPYGTGMMGSLPMFARALGQRERLVEHLDAGALADADVLVLVNQDRTLGTEATALVAGWVRDGGHLVTIGDHTLFGKGSDGRFEMFVNEPLAATDIRFANNSADHLTSAFLDATVTRSLGGQIDCVAGNPLSPVIGAGLAIGWHARPIVIGRYGYSDDGRAPSEDKGETIGDLTWNVGERLGGMVLIAAQQVGAGRVTAVGDTTGFHNIGRSMAWREVARILSSESLEPRWHYYFMAVVLLCITATSVWRSRWPLPSSATALLWLSAMAIPSAAAAVPTANPLVGTDVPLVVLDTAVYPAGRPGDWVDDGYLTLISGSLRTGALPLVTSTREHGIPAATRTILVSSPRVDPGPAWRRAVLDWVAAGGHLIVAADYTAQPLLAGLLDEVGCRIGTLAIGPQSVELGFGGERLVVRFEETWGLEFTAGSWDRVVYRGDTTSMAQRDVGKGVVTVVSDRQFLMNRNQENREIVRPDNLKLMMTLLGPRGGRR